MVQDIDYDRKWVSRPVRSKRATALRDRAIILILLDSGIRASELCALVVGDYDQERGRLYIRHGKGDKARYVFLGDRARKVLWRYLSSRPDAKQREALFATKAGTHLNRNNLHHMLRDLGHKAGVEHVHPHRFRHTFAINFLRNGGNLFELQAILGHESLATVQIYAKLAEVDIEKAGRSRSPADNWKL